MKLSIICNILVALALGIFALILELGPIRFFVQLNVGDYTDSYLDQEVAVFHLECDVFHCISVFYQMLADF